MSKSFSTLPLLLLALNLFAQDFISDKKEAGSFLLCSSSQPTTICIDKDDDWLVQKAASLLQIDIEKVTGNKPELVNDFKEAKGNVIVIGSIEKSSLIKQLTQQETINVSLLKNKWESFLIQSFQSAKPQGAKTPLSWAGGLVIAGSDKRGTAYGVFELSQQLGVSPWYWWADVPAKKKTEVFVKKGTYQFGPPSVKYRGIFINDEAPAFSGWTKEKFGGVNHLVYEKIFELLLRLKANYLWPAMWGNAFNDDDTLNPILADKYGIVMGTSHHEPMLRAQQEWKRYGKGQWNYDSNQVALKDFWRKGIQSMGTHESIVTIGMRGDGDMPMTQGSNIALLERIVSDQRKIIEEVTHKSASQTPQLWALYKEVQDYYDKGMRVPDDVTLLLCDDNWGNIRKLPKLTDKPRTGGYGIYYHFDYVGGPRNYKWINTNNIARVWEQMHLAYEYEVKNIWIVNVGDLKPMEFPISFFLDYAWNVKKWDQSNLKEYYTQWAGKQFGSEYAVQIGNVLREYSQYVARRKPELLDPNTYSLYNYNEFYKVVDDFKSLTDGAKKINDQLPIEYHDAFFELVLHPALACSNLNELYLTVARNRHLASYGEERANALADKAKELYLKDSLISVRYNQLAAGKWNHMMDQTHIGYIYWQQPPKQKMPDVRYVSKDSIMPEGVKIDLGDNTAERLVPKNKSGNLFYELNGYLCIQSSHFTHKTETNKLKWKIIPDIGRDGDGITAFPVTSAEQAINNNSPRLEYEIYTYDSGEVKVNAYFSPTLNFHNEPEGLRYAISIDDEQPQIISINKDDNDTKAWSQWVSNNIIIKTSTHKISKPGKHTVTYWMVSPAVVLQKVVIDLGGLKPSYLGPPETLFKQNKN
jgi:glycosyl hydrolase family 115 (putative glucuronidase)/glycosyl hydrolase family 115